MIKETEYNPEKPSYIPETIEKLKILEELEQVEDKSIEIPESREETERFFELDKRWSRELEPIISGLEMTALIGPKGKEGRNTDVERDEFFKSLEDPSSNYSPTFSYPHLGKYRFDQIEQSLRELKEKIKKEEGERTINRLYQHKVNIELARVGLCKNIIEGKDKNTFRYAKFMYGQVTDELYQKAQERYQEMLKEAKSEKKEEASPYKNLDKKTYRPEEIKKYFNLALKEYGFDKIWKAELSKKARAITVRQRGKEVYKILIPSERAKTDVVTLVALIAHEIETHVLRAENGRLSGLEILKGNINLDRSEYIEEGLAMLRERLVIKEIFNRKTRKALPWYALAMKKIKEGTNFRETFLDIYSKRKTLLLKRGQDETKAERLAKRQSWVTCRRIFRGMTSLISKEGYYMPMDISYLAGEAEVEEIIEKGYGKYLEVGKTNIRNLPDLVALGIKPENIKYPYQNIAKKIWERELKRKYLK